MNELQPLIDAGKRLRTAFQETIDSCPGLPRRPYEMARVLKVDKNTTSRLCSALRADDSVGMLGMLPGAIPLKQFLHAIAADGGDSQKIDAAHATLDEFEAMVKAEFDDRKGLNAVVGAIVPEMAKRHELGAKQAVFRAFETFKGISIDCDSATCFLYPNNQDRNWVDCLWLGAFFGLRRIRPGAIIQQSIRGRITRDYSTHPLGIDKDIPVFREFCRPSDMEVVRRELPGKTQFELTGSAFGRSSAVDFVIADYQTQALPLEPPPGEIRAICTTTIEPTKYSVIDLLVHESLWPDKNYELRIYDAIARGSVKLTPSTIESEQLHINESVEYLGRGIGRLRSTKIPRYLEMVNTTAQRMDWDPMSFRCYRCQMDYPVHGSMIAIVQTPYPQGPEPLTSLPA